ncbi:hypothetical protein MASR2M78_31740 [Treponema sp.]
MEVVPELLAPAAIAEVAPTLPAATAPKAPTPVPAVSVAAVPTAVASPPSFKAPLIQDLEKGSYYLQLGAYSKVATVNSELARHEGKYPLAVQSTGSSDKPIYRVLIGPVNLGESGALLQRFKRDGYKDVFIKTAH